MTGDISGTPVNTQDETSYTITLTTSSNYTKSIPFNINISDLSYDTSLDYEYLENQIFLYNPVSKRGSPIEPTIFESYGFKSFLFTPPLPKNLIISLVNGNITGIPNFAIDQKKFTLTATTTSDYKKEIQLSIKVDGFNYTTDDFQPPIDIFLDRKIILPISKNDGYSNFKVSPPFPAGLNLNNTDGEISGNIKKFDTKGKDFVIIPYNITATKNPTVTITILLKIYCNDRCPPPVIIPRQIGTFNTRAMRYSAIVSSSSRQNGRMRYITNSGTNINRTYEEPPRNKF